MDNGSVQKYTKTCQEKQGYLSCWVFVLSPSQIYKLLHADSRILLSTPARKKRSECPIERVCRSDHAWMPPHAYGKNPYAYGEFPYGLGRAVGQMMASLFLHSTISLTLERFLGRFSSEFPQQHVSPWKSVFSVISSQEQ